MPQRIISYFAFLLVYNRVSLCVDGSVTCIEQITAVNAKIKTYKATVSASCVGFRCLFASAVTEL
jgi:hypothetical protein